MCRRHFFIVILTDNLGDDIDFLENLSIDFPMEVFLSRTIVIVGGTML